MFKNAMLLGYCARVMRVKCQRLRMQSSPGHFFIVINAATVLQPAPAANRWLKFHLPHNVDLGLQLDLALRQSGVPQC